MKRKHISRKTKLAAALSLLFLTHDEAKALSEDQVESLVHWDHDPIPHAQGGEDAHYNLVPVLIMAHRKKTREIDIPQIAKTKRLTKAQEEFRARMLVPPPDRPVKQSRWAKRPFPKRRKP